VARDFVSYLILVASNFLSASLALLSIRVYIYHLEGQSPQDLTILKIVSMIINTILALRDREKVCSV
jgi:uncharacterized membrane protein SirB2